jgi:hypothetical protein
MKKFLPLICLLALCAHSSAQNMVKFETGGMAYYCPNPGFNFFVSPNGLTISNTGGAQCNGISLELQVQNFTGPGTYQFNWGTGNYGFYNPTDSPPAMQTPVYGDDPGGGSITVVRYDSIQGILEGYFNMTVSYHAFDTSDHSTVTISNGYFSFGTCYTVFNVAPDPQVPHHWFIYYRFEGVQPVMVKFIWGDGTFSVGNGTHTYATAGNYNICLEITDYTGCVATYCDASTYIYKAEDMVNVSGIDLLTTGIADPVLDERVRIYPNPSSGSVQIIVDGSLRGNIAIITDVTGRQLAKLPVIGDRLHLDTQYFPAGLYLVTIGNVTGKLVVER